MPRPGHTRRTDRDGPRRPLVAVSMVLSVLAITVLTGSAAPAGAYDGLLSSLQETELLQSVRRGLDRHPSVLLAGIVAMSVPMVALIAAGLRWRERRSQKLLSPHADIIHRSAWIEVPGRGTPLMTIGEIVRIGDSDDCDLAVAGTSGSTCALIQRTPDCEFFLFDVSAGEAHLAVNGTRSGKYRLTDGDRIEIGSACLVFRTGETQHRG